MTIDTKKQYKVLITGFEPFGTPRPKFNPSWQVAKLLNGLKLSQDHQEFLIESIEIPVEYYPVSKIIPTLHSREEYDYIIHIGQGLPDRLALETYGSAYPYNKKDNCGTFPNDHFAPHRYIPDGVEPKEFKYTTDIDTNRMASYLKDVKGYSIAQKSENAGCYLCEYTYFCSMGEAKKWNESNQTKRHVLFVHVPTPPEPYHLETITQALKDIVINLPKFTFI